MIGNGYADLRDVVRSRSADELVVTDTDRRKDRGVLPDRAKGAHEHEAKEHDLPLFDKPSVRPTIKATSSKTPSTSTTCKPRFSAASASTTSA
jgi:hypothetical protein